MSIRKRPSPKNDSAKSKSSGSDNRGKRPVRKGFGEKREDSARTSYRKPGENSRNTDRKTSYKKRGEGDESKPRRFSKGGDSPRTSRYSGPSGESREGGYRKRAEGNEPKPRRFSKNADSPKTSRYSRPSGDNREGGYRKRTESDESKPRRFSKDGDSPRTSRYSRPLSDKQEGGYKKRANTSERSARFSKDADENKRSTYSDRKGPVKKYDESKTNRSGRYNNERKSSFSSGKSYGNKRFGKNKKEEEVPETIGNTRLNKYIANAGICSRREADNLIAAGLVSVNGVTITEMGYQVKPGDQVKYNGSRLSTEKKVYLMMNKPKDTITTLDDPDKRKIVTDLLKGEDLPRVYPVGRLDRNTTGVLVLTNDGELAQRLMHPKYEVQKIYKATLNKNIKGEDLWTITQGIELEDGFIKPDSIAVPDLKNEVVIEIHSGKNRIIHRIFEHMGYSLDKLDRIWYGGLNKKSLKRGEWRELNEREEKALKALVKLK